MGGTARGGGSREGSEAMDRPRIAFTVRMRSEPRLVIFRRIQARGSSLSPCRVHEHGKDDIGDALQAHRTDVNGSHPPGAPTAQRVAVMGDAKEMGGEGTSKGEVVWWCVSVAVISKNTAIQSGSQRRPRNMHPADLVPVHRPRCRWHNQSPLFLRQIHPQFP